MKAKILVISQNTDVVQSITETLEKEGHKVSTCDIPDKVVARCKESIFNLVFIDANIREIPYEKLVTDIRKTTADIEIVIVTSYAFPESKEKGDVLDIHSYLIQPLSPDKIRSTTRRALRQGELTRENRRLLLAVTAAKKEWEATVDAIEDPIFVTDFDYNILRANLATFQSLGKGVNEVVGHKCYEVVHCASYALDDCPGKQARDSGEPASDTQSFKGFRRRYVCSVYPQVFASGGGLVHYMREPIVDAEQQAETMAKYERLFDDSRLPVLVISTEDYKVIDANQQAIQLFGYEPQTIFDMDLENLFAPSLRESTISNITAQLENKEAPLRVKITDAGSKEIDVFVVATSIEINRNMFIQVFLIPVDLLSGLRE